MAEKNSNPVRTEYETPRYGAVYIVLTAALAIASLALQLALTMAAAQAWTMRGGGITVPSNVLGMSQTLSVLPGNSVLFDGEIWISVGKSGPQMRMPVSVRPPTSNLVALNVETGKARETGLTLSPSPVGLLAHDNKLWAVSEDSVSTIVGGQLASRYPKRGLNSPTKPFLYQNQLAVIDKDKQDVFSLLTWVDGEWCEVGKVHVPTNGNTSPWTIEELRVISREDSHFLFFFDGIKIHFREGIHLVADAEPASALEPQNQIDLTDPAGLNASARTSYQGWSTTPMTATWGTTWDAAVIDGEVRAFCNNSWNGGTGIQQFQMRNGAWTTAAPTFSAPFASFSVTGGRSGYLVGNDLILYPIDESQGLQPSGPSLPRTNYGRTIQGFLIWFSPSVIAAIVLVIGTSWLMSRYRSSDYLFGKRTVQQASVLRRGFARAVDTVLTAFPPAFWWIVVVTDTSGSRLQYDYFGNSNSVPIWLFSIFGMWLAGILVLSYTEGRYGVTPGKWLCGIRTMRTTLRPCGMLRSFARQLLVYADSVLLLTWIPGVLLIAFSKDWQRLGDLASDTVVILAPAKVDRAADAA